MLVRSKVSKKYMPGDLRSPKGKFGELNMTFAVFVFLLLRSVIVREAEIVIVVDLEWW